VRGVAEQHAVAVRQLHTHSQRARFASVALGSGAHAHALAFLGAVELAEQAHVELRTLEALHAGIVDEGAPPDDSSGMRTPCPGSSENTSSRKATCTGPLLWLWTSIVPSKSRTSMYGPGRAGEHRAADELHLIAFLQIEARVVDVLQLEDRLAARGAADPADALAEQDDRGSARPDHFGATAGRDDHRSARGQARALVVERHRIARGRSGGTDLHRIGVAHDRDLFGTDRMLGRVARSQRLVRALHRTGPALRTAPQARGQERDQRERTEQVSGSHGAPIPAIMRGWLP
jgi:hypothetical protein